LVLLSLGNKGAKEVPSLTVPKLSVCADSQKVDKSKLAQTEVIDIGFSKTF